MTNDLLNYEQLVHDAYRAIVRKVLAQVSKTGLPGDHHFYIAFRTDAPGVDIPEFLRARYPEEMTIVLQHDFWGLEVDDDGFEAHLHFDRKPTRLAIPFDALTGFLDPSVHFGVRFQDDDELDTRTNDLASQSASAPEGVHPTGVEPETDNDKDSGKVIALDNFRKD